MKGIIVNTSIGKYGRFANGLFQIMGCIGIARKQGFEYAFPKFINHDHKDRFGSTEDIDIYQHLANELPEWNGAPYPERNYGWGYHEVQLPYGNHDLRGHFQSDKYFAHAIDEIRHVLTFKDEPDYRDGVAIHVRRGDYDDAYHPLTPIEYYQQAMALMPLGSKFKIFSDDIPAAIAMFGINQNFEYMRGNYIEDFKVMKRCKHFICANSSYSLAAAILSDQPGKIIVCPRNWFGPSWPDPIGMTRDLYPEGAVVI